MRPPAAPRLLLGLLGLQGISCLEITTKKGSLMSGTYTSRSGRVYQTFTSIPYALPPVGQLRFQNPIEHPGWNGVLDASGSISPYCIQLSLNGDLLGQEDCLYLNVFTHNVLGSAPVMFFIHGGGFVWGHPGPVSSTAYLMDEDIVLVSLTYRLGPMGFLSTQDKWAPGNFGLKDQALALKWIFENVWSFGGDPSRITVMGYSAGAASSNYLMLSPLSKSYVSRGISESGSALASWALTEDGVSVARQAAGYLNCPNATSQQVVECLRTVNANNLVMVQPKFYDNMMDIKPHFKVVIEPALPGAFLTRPPTSLHSTVPYLSGHTSNEGAFIGSIYLTIPSRARSTYNSDLVRWVPFVLSYNDKTHLLDYTTIQVLRKYFLKTPILNATMNSFSGSLFILPVHKAVRSHLGPSYLYYYDHRGYVSFVDQITTAPIGNLGVAHTDEYYMLFNVSVPGVNRQMTADDFWVSRNLVKLWTNFARYGNPTPRGSQFNWEESRKGKKMMYLGSNNFITTATPDNISAVYTFWECLPLYYSQCPSKGIIHLIKNTLSSLLDISN